MVYGNLLLNIKNEQKSTNIFTPSVIYNEYVNCKTLLNLVSNETVKYVLESRMEVLYEISIKDIFNFISNAIKTLIQKIRDLISKIKNLILKVFTSSKKEEDRIKRIINFLKSKVMNEAGEVTINNNYLIDRFQDTLNTAKEDKMMYFILDDYIDENYKVKFDSLNYKTKELIDKLKNSTSELEFNKSFDKFKDKYLNKEYRSYGLCKSEKILKIYGHKDIKESDDDTINYILQEEKKNHKLKENFEIFERIINISAYKARIKYIERMAEDLNKCSKDLESNMNEVYNKKIKDGNIPLETLNNFKQIILWDVKCYSESESYIRAIVRITTSAYIKAEHYIYEMGKHLNANN